MPQATLERPFFDAAELAALAARHADAYRSAAPFPHAVIDDFLPEPVARAAAEEFAGLDSTTWPLYTDTGNTAKRATSRESDMGPLLRHLSGQFASQAFVEFLEALTGIEGLVADPHLLGGGLHQLDPGGFLRIHADFNQHPQLKLDRRLNVLLYLNPGWQDDWGGALELWDAGMERCERRVTPVLNRLVVFTTLSWSYHGNPDPVRCPEGMARRSLTFFYYTNGRPEHERRPRHSTLYQTPGEAPVEPPAPSAGEAPGLLGRVRRRLS